MGGLIKALESHWGNENSDPVKVAQVILRLAASDQLPPHLLIGSDAVEYASQAEATRTADAERWREVSVSTDINTTVAPWVFDFSAHRIHTIALTSLLLTYVQICCNLARVISNKPR
ncbi:MAG: short-chain dehydrogenase/reductase [Candidatus Acidoferrum typicum]|nr:short-chain dehydrogenase/reductase [Candidatus Acidoferrum typicum]